MSTLSRSSVPISPPTPTLEPGDRLSRAEFERRYNALPEVKKAELIEGEVQMASPVRWSKHGRPHMIVMTWLGTYESLTPGVAAGDNASVRLDLDNEPQPDALLIIEPSSGGQVRISDDDYVEGAPDLVFEVAASSVSIDLHKKLRAYQRNGVGEYVVWRVEEKALDWFVLRDGAFVPLVAVEGTLRSARFPGLWLNAQAMVDRQLARVLEVVRAGCLSAEHAAFIDRVARP